MSIEADIVDNAIAVLLDKEPKLREKLVVGAYIDGKIVFFRVQFETKIDHVWYPVVRYDTAHGFAHRDMLNNKGETRKTPLFNQDHNDALTFAENDLKSNWKYYKERFLEEKNEAI